jgi:hypothetical protein
MYLPNLLNTYGLFQHTSGLNSESEFADDLALLLSRATSAVVCINRIDFLQKQCFAEFDLFDDQITDFDDRIVFYSESLVELQNQISPLLSALRMMQDILNQLIRRKFPILTLPRSISDTIKGIDKYELPEEIKTLLTSYWSNCGSRLRDLRILDQHYSSIVDNILLQTKPDRRIVLLFPDNSEEKSSAKWIFKDKIDGISELRIGFDETHQLIEDIFQFLGYTPSALTDSVKLSQLGELTPFRKRTLSLWVEKKVKVEGNIRNMNIKGMRIGQNEDGKLELQNMIVSDKKIAELNEKLKKQ